MVDGSPLPDVRQRQCAPLDGSRARARCRRAQVPLPVSVPRLQRALLGREPQGSYGCDACRRVWRRSRAGRCAHCRVGLGRWHWTPDTCDPRWGDSSRGRVGSSSTTARHTAGPAARNRSAATRDTAAFACTGHEVRYEAVTPARAAVR